MSDVVPAPGEPMHPVRVRELDGLRGLAALGVFCHHALYSSIPYVGWGWFVNFTRSFTQWGLYGVDLFFVLSGFLITSIILRERDQPHYYWNFYWRRALRILPLLAVLLIWLAVSYPVTRRYVVLAALFLANFERLFGQVPYGPYWTLSIEEQFYLFWPGILRYRSVRGIETLSIGIASACLLLRLLAGVIGHHNYRFTFFHCDGLALGALLACQIFRWSQMPTEAREAQRSLRPILGAIACGIIMIAAPTVLSLSGRAAILCGALALTGVSLLGYSAVRFSVMYQGARYLAILRSRVLTFFGLISYAFYLSHEYVISFYDRRYGRLHVGDTRGFLTRAVMLFGLTVALSVISRYVIERPAMSLRRYILRR